MKICTLDSENCSEARFTMAGGEWVSALSILGVSFMMSLATTLLNRKFQNQEKTAGWQDEIKRWNADMARAKKAGDKKLMAKLKKQEKRISQMQSQISKGQMFSMLSNMGLFIVMWQLLGFLYGSSSVAYLPFALPFLTEPPPVPMSFFYWYIFCSMLSSSLVSRILGVSMGVGMQPETTR